MGVLYQGEGSASSLFLRLFDHFPEVLLALLRGFALLSLPVGVALLVLHACIIAPLWPHARGWRLFLVALSACPIRGRGRRRISRSWDSFGLS